MAQVQTFNSVWDALAADATEAKELRAKSDLFMWFLNKGDKSDCEDETFTNLRDKSFSSITVDEIKAACSQLGWEIPANPEAG